MSNGIWGSPIKAIQRTTWKKAGRRLRRAAFTAIGIGTRQHRVRTKYPGLFSYRAGKARKARRR